MAYITFNDKTYLNQNPSVPAANKVQDIDMNEIKSVVNSNYDEAKDDINSFFYKSGDEVELGSTSQTNFLIMNGLITTSTTSVFVNITTPKRLDNITTIAVNNFNVALRGISGYLNSNSSTAEYVGDTNYTITANISSPTSITLRLTKSSAFTNVTNNTPVVLNGYVKMTLS